MGNSKCFANINQKPLPLVIQGNGTYDTVDAEEIWVRSERSDLE